MRTATRTWSPRISWIAPVPKLDFTVRIRVGDALASVDDSTGTRKWAGFEGANVVPYSISGHSADVYVSAGAEAAGCMPYCITGSTMSVLSQWAPGTLTTAGKD